MNWNWLDIVFGGGGTAVGASIVAFVKRGAVQILKDMIAVALADIKRDIVDLKVTTAATKAKLDAETGGNSNGLRQAVNEVKADVAHVKGHLGL